MRFVDNGVVSGKARAQGIIGIGSGLTAGTVRPVHGRIDCWRTPT